MDLTKITLPTFILERRSFLEMLADFLAHPDQFVQWVKWARPAVHRENERLLCLSVWQSVQRHVIDSSRLSNGIFRRFMPVERVQYQRNPTILFWEKRFNVCMTFIRRRLLRRLVKWILVSRVCWSSLALSRQIWPKTVLFPGHPTIMSLSLPSKLRITRRVRPIALLLWSSRSHWFSSCLILRRMSGQTYSDRWMSVDQVEISRPVRRRAYDWRCHSDIAQSRWTICDDFPQCIWPVNTVEQIPLFLNNVIPSLRSILGVPWFEMGGKVSIDCEKTGYSAHIEFLTKVRFLSLTENLSAMVDVSLKAFLQWKETSDHR